MSGVWRQKQNLVNRKAKESIVREDCNSAGDVAFLKPRSQQANIQAGYGKKNPNALKGRERRGKRKSN